jgi:hypothetical protein
MITAHKPRKRTTGVFCIENWSARMTNRTTIRPLLEWLEQEAGVPYILRHADDREDLLYLLERSAGYGDHRVVYVACHGKRGALLIGGTTARIDDLASDLSLRLRGKTVYFGSCATGADGASLKRFRERTGAETVCGYADPKGVDSLTVGAFELLLMRALTEVARSRTGLRRLRREAADLWKELKFVAVPRPD